MRVRAKVWLIFCHCPSSVAADSAFTSEFDRAVDQSRSLASVAADSAFTSEFDRAVAYCTYYTYYMHVYALSAKTV